MTALITIKEVSEALKVSRAGLYRLIQAKELPVVRIGARLRFDPVSIQKFVDARRQGEKRTAA